MISVHICATLFAPTSSLPCFSSFFFNATPTTEIYTLSLHDALPISPDLTTNSWVCPPDEGCSTNTLQSAVEGRSEEHTSELQSRGHLVCRLLLEKKKKASTRT